METKTAGGFPWLRTSSRELWNVAPNASPTMPQPLMFHPCAPINYQQHWQQGVPIGHSTGVLVPANTAPYHIPGQPVPYMGPPIHIMPHHHWPSGVPAYAHALPTESSCPRPENLAALDRPMDLALPGTLHGHPHPPGGLPAVPHPHPFIGWGMPAHSSGHLSPFPPHGPHMSSNPQLISPFQPAGIGSVLPPALSRPAPTSAGELSCKQRQTESLRESHLRQEMPVAGNPDSVSDCATTVPVLPGCPPGAFPRPLNPQTFDPLAAWFRRHYGPSQEESQPAEEEVDSGPKKSGGSTSPLNTAAEPPILSTTKDAYIDSKMGLEPCINFEPVRPRKRPRPANQRSASGVILKHEPSMPASGQAGTRISRASVKWWLDMQQCFGPAVMGAREMQPGTSGGGSAGRNGTADLQVDAAAGSNLTGGGITMVASCGSDGRKAKHNRKRNRGPRTKSCAQNTRQKGERETVDHTAEDSSGGSRCSSPPYSWTEPGELQNGSSSPGSSPPTPNDSSGRS